MKIENGNIARYFQWQEGIFCTSEIVNKRTQQTIKSNSKAEFIIDFENDLQLSSADCFALVKEESDTRIVVGFCHPVVRLSIVYEARSDVLSKQIQIEFTHLSIRYIDVEVFDFEDDDYLYYPKKQKDIKEMANFSGYYVELGQPIYAKSLFWGMEFPMGENRLKETTYFSRYYLGDSVNNKKTIWPTIVGAGQSINKPDIQQDFYGYLENISQPSYFRKQYNSWYDHMTDISEESILESFSKIRYGFETNGIHLDAFVVDDGWADYQSVWEFNNKFPNELKNIQQLVHTFGSNLGLWIGPRGGYNGTEITMSDWLEAHSELQLGTKNPISNDVNVADFRYLEKLKEKMLAYQEKYDISYWKIDGWLLAPDKADKSGPYGMYTMTRVYEFLIGLLKELREARGNKDLWLNLTSYVNPSPWFLQWVNSLWIQVSQDVGFEASAGSDLARMLTYRDIQYQEFLEERDIQLPLWALYNHEPIYAVSANTWYMDHQMFATVKEFEEYLMFAATRGNGFWEFHYSFDMFDDQRWKANARAVKWIEKHYDTLKYSTKIGGSPKNFEVYGYHCCNNVTGSEILSLRNPADKTQKIKVGNLSSYECILGFFNQISDELILPAYSIAILYKNGGT